MRRAVKFLLEHACAALFLDPGMSKTAITLAALKVLKEAGVLRKALIVAPVRVIHSTWPNELKKWTDFHGLTYVILHGDEKDELLERDVDLYIINYEGLPWLTQVEKSRKLVRDPTTGALVPSKKVNVAVDRARWKRFGFDTLVLDELSKFKNYGTQRYKIIERIHGTFARRFGLTGSPAPKGLLDLFAQCFVLDEGRALGRYVTHYRKEHFFNPPYEPYKWELKEGHDELIYARVKPLALRLAAAEYLQLPQLVETPVRVELPEAAMKVYKKLEADLIAQLDAKVVTAANAGVATGKCRQIASGALYLTPDVPISSVPQLKAKGKREFVELHEEKLDALADLLDELQGQPLLCAYEFEHDLERLRAKFGKETPAIGKHLKPKEMGALIERWNRGEVPLLLAQAASAAHGIDGLQNASARHIAWFTLTWDFEVYEQFIYRLRRQGSTAKQLFVYHFLAADTVDYDVLASLRRKEKGQLALFAALRDRAAKR